MFVLNFCELCDELLEDKRAKTLSTNHLFPWAGF